MKEPTYRYDPKWVVQKYDGYGVQEWERLTKTPLHEVQLAIHTHFLHEHVRSGDRVLEVGAGAGRFTQILVELGACVSVLDISPGQLELNRKYAKELRFEHGIEAWIQADMCDLPQIEASSFDAVVCYGGPLSYVFEKRGTAMREMLRTLRPGGVLLLSVMSLWGTSHEYLVGVLDISPEENLKITSTGDLCPQTFADANHFCHMFRSDELRGFLEGCGTSVLAMSASSCLSHVWGEALLDVRKDEGRWNELLRMELEASRESGCLDMGTHIIAAVQKPLV